MPKIKLNIYCATCGAGLCNQAKIDGLAVAPSLMKFDVSVEVCQNCLENAKQDGYDEGYNEAEKET